MINAYVHERSLLQLCGNKGLGRIVRAIDSGMIRAPSQPGGMIFYLVFEQASCDARTIGERMQNLDVAWHLSILHQITVGLHQLHTVGIAHQDLKPSNILLFPSLEAKVGDLGRACCTTIDAPHADEVIAGDPDYAPPELLYGQIDPDWRRRRLGCDLYLLGSMAAYFFTGQATTHLLMGNIDLEMNWKQWAGDYQQVLPYLRFAFDEAVENISAHIQSKELRGAISTVVRQLCDPDPLLRGHPADRGRNNNQFSLNRYMGQFNTWAHRARSGWF